MEKVYKIYDNWRKEEVFEGTSEEYRQYVTDIYRSLEEDFEEEYKKIMKLGSDIKRAKEILKNKDDFEVLFEKLEFENLNVFGDCVDLEVRDEEGNFLYKR